MDAQSVAELKQQRDEAVALMEKNRDDANKFIAALKAEVEDERRERRRLRAELDRASSRLFVVSCAIGKLQDVASRLWVAVSPDEDALGVAKATTGIATIPPEVWQCEPQEHDIVLPGVG